MSPASGTWYPTIIAHRILTGVVEQDRDPGVGFVPRLWSMLMAAALGVALAGCGDQGLGAAPDETDLAPAASTTVQIPREVSTTAYEVVSTGRENEVVTVAIKPVGQLLELVSPEPVLMIADTRHIGSWQPLGDDGTIELTFNVPPTDRGPATLILPWVSMPIAFEASAPLGAGVLEGPAQSHYQIQWAGMGEVQYVVDTPGAPAISLASIVVDGSEVVADGSSSRYDSSGNAIDGVLRFPTAAGGLAELDGAELHVSEFRGAVEVRLDLCLVEPVLESCPDADDAAAEDNVTTSETLASTSIESASVGQMNPLTSRKAGTTDRSTVYMQQEAVCV